MYEKYSDINGFKQSCFTLFCILFSSFILSSFSIAYSCYCYYILFVPEYFSKLSLSIAILSLINIVTNIISIIPFFTIVKYIKNTNITNIQFNKSNYGLYNQ